MAPNRPAELATSSGGLLGAIVLDEEYSRDLIAQMIFIQVIILSLSPR